MGPGDELGLDEHGEDEVRDWLLRGDRTPEQRSFVRSVLEGVATRRPYDTLGWTARNTKGDTYGDTAITDPRDPKMTVVIIPWTGDATTFSIRYVGDLADLE